MVRCKYCGMLIPEEFARQSGGYCELDEYSTTEHVAARLHVQPQTIMGWFRKGKLPHMTVDGGGRALVRRGDIDKLLIPHR